MEMLPPDMEPLPARVDEPEKDALHKVEGYIVFCTRVLFWLAGAGLMVMTALIVADVIGIKILSRPVPGGIEWVSFMAVVAIAFAVPYTQVMHGHVAVDFIVDMFPRRAKLVVEVFTGLLSVALLGFLAFYSFKYAGVLRSSGEVSMTQQIPFHPFVYGMAVCFVATFLILVLQLIRTIMKAGRQWTR